MKTYPEEISIYQNHARTAMAHPELNPVEREEAQTFISSLREKRRARPRISMMIEWIPLAFMAAVWGFLVFVFPARIASGLLFSGVFGVLHGALGYSYVVYTLHLGAGHHLFNGRFLRGLAFHSSRLLFADPVQYREAHVRHHRSLGSEEDGAFTQYVLPRRILKSLLPGAGILFPNDYKIHHGEEYTRSRLLSDAVGLAFLAIEVAVVSSAHEWYWTLPALVLIAPWVGSLLDRTRESLEHQLMPAHPQYGTREFGLNFWGLLWGGGPWGQPCHFSHHFAPDLHWLDQIRLHRHLNAKLRPELLDFYGFRVRPTPRFAFQRLLLAIKIGKQGGVVAWTSLNDQKSF